MKEFQERLDMERQIWEENFKKEKVRGPFFDLSSLAFFLKLPLLVTRLQLHIVSAIK